MDASAILPTTLLILYFTTTPSPGPKNEAKSVWTLASTSQTQFKSPDACFKIGTKLIAAIRPVANLTVRAYCLCENGNDKTQKCPKETIAATLATGQPVGVPTIEALPNLRSP